MRFVHDHQDAFEVKRMCELVELPRSSFYAWLNHTPSAREIADAELLDVIGDIYRRLSPGSSGAASLRLLSVTAVPKGDQLACRPVVRVVLADDNFLLREGLERLLSTVEDLEVVGSCGDADRLLELVAEQRPDAVLTDIRMPPTHTDEGVRAALAIRAEHPSTGVVVLSQHASPSYAIALVGGATTTGIGYLLKDRVSDVQQLAGALRTVATGGSVVDPLVVQELIAARRVLADSPLALLSERELEVLAAMADGLSNAAIAASTFSSERTVEKHINTIFTKLTLPNEPDTNRRVKAVLVYLSQLSR